MTDGTSSNSGRPGSYGTASGGGNVPRRLSYASVASGAPSQNTTASLRSGAFTPMAGTNPHESNSSIHTTNPYHSRTYSQEQDSVVTTVGQQPHLPWYSRKYSSVGPWKDPNAFIIPSYLRESRYVAKLKALHAQRMKPEKEARAGQYSGVSSTSQSSGGVNMHRIAPSHRGMTYEVIESNPPKEEDQLMPLPTRWNDQDKYPGLEVFNDGLEVRYNGSISKSEVEAASIRADFPMSPACGVFYFEVEIRSKNKDCAVAVGFSTQKASLERLPGWEPESWAYHGDDGKTFSGEHNGRAYSHTFTDGDVVGCGINFNTGQAFFTKNGLDLGIAFRDLKNVKPFPSVGIKKSSGATVAVNFGQQPFVFDIDEKVYQEQKAVESQITKTKTSSLHPTLDETSLIQELVSQFLIHGGYVETSKAFEEEVKREKMALNNSTATSFQPAADIDTTNAANRQQIRRAILAGDIDLALDITNNHYPVVLQNSPDIVFNLKCRKWVELIGKAADLRARQLSTEESRKSGRASNGFAKFSAGEAVEDVFDQHMELDEEQQLSINGTGKAPAPFTPANADNGLAYHELLNQAMQYGQILQREYRDAKDGGYTKILLDIFSLIAYSEPRNSEHGHLLDQNGRIKVAEELNSAILVSLGRPATAALEKTYKQTEVLLDILGADGGPASFVNLKAMFERR